ncbi:hypothetical protein MTR67_019321 [Solanum verrucosum]|uniref:Mutator-like transposase n=1 Tax=Solanum verrucosum TaxID=315347 RepID=A0AAF0QME7_SOLVR|nr:hypothetical protein MTR67_019321 [Solanum verrucosum]
MRGLEKSGRGAVPPGKEVAPQDDKAQFYAFPGKAKADMSDAVITCAILVFGESVIVTQVYRACLVLVMGFQTWADFVILDITNFDIILGMTWLSPYYVMLNCNTKSVTLEIPDREKLEWEGGYKPKSAKVISSIWARKLVGQGCLAYLAHIRDVEIESPSTESILVVSEFKKVFSTYLPGMPPNRDIDFCIDLELGTRPISISPYRMALVELRELKAQIQELLDKGFIRPSASSWGAPVLFVKKMDDIQLVDLRTKEIKSVKVQWKHRPVEEATWEIEKDKRDKYPQIFDNSDTTLLLPSPFSPTLSLGDEWWESLIFTKIYHGGILSEISIPTYVGNCVSALRYIIKDHFSILELLYYTKELGYETVGSFYVKDLLNKKWVLITTDQHLLHLIKDLKHEDTFEVFVCHVLDETLLDTEGPRGYLTNVGGESVDIDLGEEGEAVNLGGEGEAVDLSGEGEVVNLGGEGVDVNISEEGVDDNLGRDGVDDNLGGEGESDFLSSDSDLDIPSKDGSDIDKELRAFRQERRNKKQRKKATEFEEIPVGEAGGIDRGFEDIGKNKTDKYAGKLGGDEDYIDSSDCCSDDSDEQLDVDAVRGVDIPTRRRSKKVRYDEDYEVSIFELGMVFEGANQFRKAVADYVVEYMRQIKLRPNEKHRVRVKCKNANYKWLLYASIDRDSGDFIVKNYHPVHKCIPLNRNKLCNSKLIARKFKDRIVSQPYIRIWEIQDLVRKTLGLYVGKTLCYRAKQRIMKENMGDWKVEFARLCYYADMIKQTNPGSFCWVKIDKETEPGKNLFVYFYVCFHAFKQGWLEGCRNIIGFDGCFLKGACKGELLVAVGKNGNNQMYLIAWAVVDTETKHSWSWFIRYLIVDLNLGTGEGLTVMLDMQKGLIPVLSEFLPNAEKRMYARHIWNNWHVNWKGEERRK